MSGKKPWHEVMQTADFTLDKCADAIIEVVSRLRFFAPDSDAIKVLNDVIEKIDEQSRAIHEATRDKMAEEVAAAQQASENMLNAAVIGMKLAGIPTPNPQEKEQ